MPDPNREFASYATNTSPQHFDMNRMGSGARPAAGSVWAGWSYYDTGGGGIAVSNGTAYFEPNGAADGWA